MLIQQRYTRQSNILSTAFWCALIVTIENSEAMILSSLFDGFPPSIMNCHHSIFVIRNENTSDVTRMEMSTGERKVRMKTSEINAIQKKISKQEVESSLRSRRISSWPFDDIDSWSFTNVIVTELRTFLFYSWIWCSCRQRANYDMSANWYHTCCDISGKPHIWSSFTSRADWPFFLLFVLYWTDRQDS